jgi:hypothetical protein
MKDSRSRKRGKIVCVTVWPMILVMRHTLVPSQRMEVKTTEVGFWILNNMCRYNSKVL